MEEVTLKQTIEQELHNLDLFNLEVAKYRLEHGISSGLIHLYGAMGRLCEVLLVAHNEAELIGQHWNTVTRNFQLMKDKEEKDGIAL